MAAIEVENLTKVYGQKSSRLAWLAFRLGLRRYESGNLFVATR